MAVAKISLLLILTISCAKQQFDVTQYPPIWQDGELDELELAQAWGEVDLSQMNLTQLQQFTEKLDLRRTVYVDGERYWAEVEKEMIHYPWIKRIAYQDLRLQHFFQYLGPATTAVINYFKMNYHQRLASAQTAKDVYGLMLDYLAESTAPDDFLFSDINKYVKRNQIKYLDLSQLPYFILLSDLIDEVSREP